MLSWVCCTNKRKAPSELGVPGGGWRHRTASSCCATEPLKSLFFPTRTVARTMPKASATPAQAAASAALATPVSYEAALEEMEQLVARIESGQLPLDQMLASYQRGAVLLGFCRERLTAVQDQIQVLDDGQLQPWTQE